MTEDAMVGWHHGLSGHEFEQTPGDGKGQGSQACCIPQGRIKSDMTEPLSTHSWPSSLSWSTLKAEVSFDVSEEPSEDWPGELEYAHDSLQSDGRPRSGKNWT